MLHIINNNKSARQRISALQEIKSKYKKLIGNDHILTNDFSKLMGNTRLADQVSEYRSTHLVTHMIAEIWETTGDSQRIADESPRDQYNNSEANNLSYEYHELGHELENYKTDYLEN